jgi:hypothetical protein
MYETSEDLAELQAVIDRSYETAGAHLLEIHTPERRLTAAQLSDRLTGMCLLTVATVTADGRPLTGPVDGMFYRGAFWFGSSPDSVRFRHLRQRPAVSATHLPGEHLSVTVHGRAETMETVEDLRGGFRDYCIEIYGEEWENWGSDAGYARIAAERVFTFHMEPPAG